MRLKNEGCASDVVDYVSNSSLFNFFKDHFFFPFANEKRNLLTRIMPFIILSYPAITQVNEPFILCSTFHSLCKLPLLYLFFSSC